MNTCKTIFVAAAMALSFSLCTKVNADPIFEDDFSSGSVGLTFRIYESLIDDGWQKQMGYGSVVESAWTIADGKLKNASSVAAAGYPDSTAAEAPTFSLISNPASPSSSNFDPFFSSTDNFLQYSFEYSVGANDSLYAHLWGVTGVSDDDGQNIGNTEGPANGSTASDAGDSDELTAYSLLTGDTAGRGTTAQSISGQLTGSGVFSTTIDIGSLGIAGVADVGDFTYFVLHFAKDEDGSVGTTAIDNLSVVSSAIPEPSSLGLLAMAFGLLLAARKRLKK